MRQKLVLKMVSLKIARTERDWKPFRFQRTYLLGVTNHSIFFLTNSEEDASDQKFFPLVLVLCHVNWTSIQNSISCKTFYAHVLVLQITRKQHRRLLFTILSLNLSSSKQCHFESVTISNIFALYKHQKKNSLYIELI